MPRIEELPDDFDAALDLNKVPSAATKPNAGGIPASAIDQSLPFPNSKRAPPSNLPDGAATAKMPPAMANTRAHTAEEVMTMLNRTPLFMTELDETDGQGGTNADLEALRALAYEGTRAQVADGFRERGNECVAERDWKNARDFYTRALNYLRGVGEEGRKAAETHGATNGHGASAEDKLKGKQTWSRRTETGALDGGEGAAEVNWADTGDAPADWTPEKEQELAKATEEKCAANRARCNLELKNYRAAIQDCAQALRINPRNVKAYYRSATALLALDKVNEAADAINYCLSLDKNNPPAEALSKKISARADFLAAKERERQQREERKRQEIATLQLGLKARGYAVKMTRERPTDVEDAELSLADPLDASSELTMPVLLLYPTAGQTDMLKSVSEHTTLNQHLEYILPPPWDSAGEFGGSNGQRVDLFADTVTGGLVKVGKKVPIREVLQGNKVVLQDGLWRVHVVPKTKVSSWLEEVKKRRPSQKR